MRQYFSAIFGNRDCCRTLGESIEKETLSHAIMIEGAAGSGKRTLAKEIAMASFCENRHDQSKKLPCRSCRACHLVEEGLTPDVHILRRAERATIGVETVREMRADATLSATEFDYKFYIFEDAHKMTVQAQNALLKVMEEPPASVKIILLTESADAMLTTVRSRARLIRMQRFTTNEIASYLENNHPSLLSAVAGEKEELPALLLTAKGSIGAALQLLTPQSRELIKKERAEILCVLCALGNRSHHALLEAVLALPQKREEFSEALMLLHTALRDLILLKRSEEPPLSFFPSAASIPEEVSTLRIGPLFAFADAVELTLTDLEKNANTATAGATLVCRLRNAQKER